jgi:hypothetical protein
MPQYRGSLDAPAPLPPPPELSPALLSELNAPLVVVDEGSGSILVVSLNDEGLIIFSAVMNSRVALIPINNTITMATIISPYTKPFFIASSYS